MAFLSGCERPKAPAASVSTHQLSAAAGFIEWADASGNVFVLRTFDRDTNGDGQIEGKTGEHGEVEGDVPTLHVVDRHGRAILQAEELLATDASARFFVAVVGGKGVLFDAQTRGTTDLNNIDLSSDGNPCMKPRAAAFDISGRWLGWMTQDQQYRVRDLRTGAEQQFKPPGKLWRAEPVPYGWVAMKIVGDGQAFPRAKTSCACSWCPRFARSIGNYGFEGESTAYLVGPDEAFALTAAWLPLSPTVLFDTRSQTLKDGSLPSGCKVAAYALGAPALVLACGATTELWNPTTRVRVPLDGVRVSGPQTLASWTRAPSSFVESVHDGVTSVSVLNWETGAVTKGPPVRNLVGTFGEWAVGQTENQVVYFSVDGRQWTYPGTAQKAHAAFQADVDFGVNLETGRAMPRTPGELVSGPCAITAGFKQIAVPTVVCVD
ncbi:MAG: hypothetical protein R3E66_14565 [bacterium]